MALQARPTVASQGAKRVRKPINRQSLHDYVVTHLRQMIVSGTLAPGDKIDVTRLAETLDVSLTPIREGLKVLAGEKLVQLVPNKSARVAPITVEDTVKLFDVISGIEALAAELTASRITPAQLEKLEALHSDMRDFSRRGETKSYFALNKKIHDLLVEYSGNEILGEVRSQLARRAERVRFLALASSEHRLSALQDHEDLMEALRQRKPDEVHRIWRAHLISSGQETCRILVQMRAMAAEKATSQHKT
ncbi:GntR family transcriptional regulator [Sedimentitalea sp. JM2-8]|uniref:GntR family transcriptional regulator n=1 Tax=Sedimentitalea xiamensis TaxID=3050037 RepID=A0ABT7FF70_9RHOB|nr:GntR family transcriptional regulator [Sedimentitalea xiamensis]MDK3073625.1 GntR family transcriptional regulator [Sedimentitalea xiamensis]